MAVYAIGDVQGCYDELRALLDRIAFDPVRDRLWFVGDLVNRGPRSLDVLRFVCGLGAAAVTVLGNHDLHLVAAAAGARDTRAKDTFTDVLRAPDRDALVDWLCACPLVHEAPEFGFTLVHAGLPPQWTIADAVARAREVQATLGGPERGRFLRHMYGDDPGRWRGDLAGFARLRFVVNALTRMRYCTRDGCIDVRASGAPGSEDPALVPWYDAPGRASAGARIVFGHWSTLRLGARLPPRDDVFPVDTGCVWGGPLTALRLDDREYLEVPGRAG